MTPGSDYVADIERWRARRLERLAAEDGWLNLIGRWDLEHRTATIGSASESDIALPLGPARLGTITQKPSGEIVFLPSNAGEIVSIVPDGKTPQRFHVDRFLFEIMTVGGRSHLRARDKQHPARRTIPNIDYFDIDEGWRVSADWVPLDNPIEAEIETMIGTVNLVSVTHKATFTHEGRRYELLPSYGTPQSPQFVIRDETAPAETYPASRFLYGEDISGGKIVLDFNKAINPPCAFTDFAVCPLPPPQNILPFPVRAGEKKLRD
jgi:uncharacterized protein (DUF1684 family)